LMVASIANIFLQSSALMLTVLVMSLGIFSAFMLYDIKRVVAYSTLSQLGYMTVALGASAYSVAVFHLMTHAFFKALLFLGAGSV
ncbi:proton-conducting transporter membrane subunit, partial [Klebsiella pneumoniae]